MAEQSLLDVDVINKSLASVTYDPDLIDFIVALQGANTTMSAIHSSMTAYRDAYLALYQSVPKYSGDSITGEEDITIQERINLEREPLAATLNGMRSYISVLIKLYRATGIIKVPVSRTILVDQVEKVEIVPTSSSQTTVTPRSVSFDIQKDRLSKGFTPSAHHAALELETLNSVKYNRRPSINIKGHSFKPSAAFTSSWDDEAGKLSVSDTKVQPNLMWNCTDSGSDNLSTSGSAFNIRAAAIQDATALASHMMQHKISAVDGVVNGDSGSIAFSVKVTKRSNVPVTVSMEADVSKYALFQDLLRPVAVCVADYIEFVQSAVGSNAYSADDIAILRG